MNRKDFFKKLGAGAIVAAVAPKVLAQSPEKEFIAGCDPAVPGGDISVLITNMEPSITPLDTIIMEAKKRGYDFSESD